MGVNGSFNPQMYFQNAQHGVHADPAPLSGASGLDSYQQIGFFRGFGFYPFRERVSSLQPPVTRAVGRQEKVNSEICRSEIDTPWMQQPYSLKY